MNESMGFFSRLFDEFRGRYEIDDLKESFFYILFLKHYNNTAENIPEQCQWDYLEREIHSNLLYKLMLAFKELEKLQPQLHGVFDDFELPVRWSYQKYDNVVRVMFRYISDMEKYVGKGSFEQFFEEMLIAFDSTLGKTSGNLILPAQLTDLMHSFIPKGNDLDIYNPFAGTGSLSIGLNPNNKYLGVEEFRKARALGQIRLLVHDLPHQQIISGNALYNLHIFEEKRFGVVIFNPPFNLKLRKEQEHQIYSQQNGHIENKYLSSSNATSYIIHHCFNYVKTGGRMIFVIPNAFLYSQAKNDVSLRNDLLRYGQVETIIALPSRTLTHSNIPINLVVLIKGNHANRVCMIDARDSIVKSSNNKNQIDVDAIIESLTSENSSKKRYIDYDEIVGNEYSLLPDRYFINENDYNELELANTVELGRLVTFIPPIRFRGKTKGKKIGIRELADNPDSYALGVNNIEKSDIQNNEAVLPHNSLLMANKGEKLKPTFFAGEEQNVFYTHSNIFSFTVNTNEVLLEYLIQELHKDYTINQLQKFRVGSGIPSINRENLLSIRIKLPTLDEQQKIVAKERQERFRASLKELGFENEIARLKKEQKEDLRSKKHNILQHMNNVKSSADVLLQFMRKNNGVLTATEVIIPKRKVTVEKRFERLLESLEEAIYHVDNLTNDIAFGKKSNVDLRVQINNYIEKGLHSDTYEINFVDDSDSFMGSDSEIKPLVYISASDFAELYNNIIENAVTHGFTEKDKKYQFLIELFYSLEDKKVVLRFSNDGLPFAKGMSERFGIKGEKAGKTGKKGYGAWKIIEIVKHWSASYIIIDEPAKQFPVGLELRFNLENE